MNQPRVMCAMRPRMVDLPVVGDVATPATTTPLTTTPIYSDHCVPPTAWTAARVTDWTRPKCLEVTAEGPLTG